MDKPLTVTNCYYCGRSILSTADLVKVTVPLVCKNGKVRNYNRKLHASCSVEYSEKRKDEQGSKLETNDWYDLYEYVRELIYDGGIVPDFMRQRLQGARLGLFVPNGSNVKLLKKGYPYSTILMCFRFSKPSILQHLSTNKFKDEKHLINAIMYIVTNNLPDVDRRIKRQIRSNEKLQTTLESSGLNEERKFDNFIPHKRETYQQFDFGESMPEIDNLFD